MTHLSEPASTVILHIDDAEIHWLISVTGEQGSFEKGLVTYFLKKSVNSYNEIIWFPSISAASRGGNYKFMAYAI